MSTIFLVRHGEVERDFQGRCRGFSDCELSPEGVEMSIKNAQFLVRQGIERVFTTGRKRTDFVGKYLNQNHGIAHYVTEEFRDPHCGLWEGRMWHDLYSEDPQLIQTFEDDIMHMKFPGGERMVDVHDRVITKWQWLIRQHFTQIALVAHGVINSIILSDIRGEVPTAKGQLIGSMNKVHVIDPAKNDVRIEWANRLVYTEDDPQC